MQAVADRCVMLASPISQVRSYRITRRRILSRSTKLAGRGTILPGSPKLTLWSPKLARVTRWLCHNCVAMTKRRVYNGEWERTGKIDERAGSN